METLSIEDQISYVMGADEIATTMGTLAHWAMFCKPTTKFIMLNRAHTGSIFFQVFINEAFNVNDYYSIDVYKSFLYVRDHTNGLFLLGSTKYWTAFVEDYFGEKISEEDDVPYLEESLDKYINLWCRRFPNPTNGQVWHDSLRGMIDRIRELEREKIINRPLLTYQTHIANKGWGDWKNENQLSNPVNQQLDIQAIKINFPSHAVYYSVYYDDTWSEEVAAPNMAGTTGKKKPIYGIKIHLDEADAKTYEIFYRVHKFDGTWTAWAKNGAELLSDGQKLNALQILLKDKAQ